MENFTTKGINKYRNRNKKEILKYMETYYHKSNKRKYIAMENLKIK